MAKETRKRSFEYALRDEGEGLSTYKGLKKYGIELPVLEVFSPSQATPDALAKLDRPRALRLYAKVYWKYPGCDDLSPGLDYFVFDSSLVCGGPGVVARWLQLLAGPVGRTYEEAVEYLNSLDLETALSGIEFYRRRRFKSDPLWGVLGPEWTNRTNRAKQRALKLGAVAQRDVLRLTG